jgi:hypothetical protein
MSTIIELEESAAINSKTMLEGGGFVREPFVFDKEAWLSKMNDKWATLPESSNAVEWHVGPEEPRMECDTIRLWKDGTVDYGRYSYPYWECQSKKLREKSKYRGGKPLWWAYMRDVAEAEIICPDESELDTAYLVFVNVPYDHPSLECRAEIGYAVEDVDTGRVWHERKSGAVIEGEVVRCFELPEGYVDAIL